MYINYPDDIRAHIPTLESYASKCNVCVELGVRWGNGSTAAFRTGFERNTNKDNLWLSVDLIDTVQKIFRPGFPFWTLILGDTTDTGTVNKCEEILKGRKADLIFIDTVHNYTQMKKELETWKCIASDNCNWLFHDTWQFGTYNRMTTAIKEFAKENNLLYEDITKESNGLGLLRPNDK